MKKITLLLLIILLGSCAGKQETALTYTISPNETYSYMFVLSSKILTITQEVDFKLINTTSNGYEMEVEIQDMEWEDGGDNEAGINQYYRDTFIKKPLTFIINTHGKLLERLAYKYETQNELPVFDINNFFIELPSEIQKTGNSWTRTRPTNDIMFKNTSSKYTLHEIKNDTLAHIKVSSEFRGKNKKYTKKLDGTYIINIKNGMLETGELKIGGFNGFSDISGTIRIYKK